jgi:hypothetical protein
MRNLFVILLLCSLYPAGASDAIWPCLPEDVTEDTAVSAPEGERTAGKTEKSFTVSAALRKLEARCRDGKLVDKAGREIYFFHRIGCWGNPPEDYVERLARQTEEIERLKKDYTVLEIPCGPTDPAAID